MKRKLVLLGFAAVLVCMAIPRHAAAQSLNAELKKQFRATRFGVDASGLVVTDPGVVLVVRKPGIRSFPPSTMALPTTRYQDGKISTPPNNPFLGPNKLLPVDTRVYVMKMVVNPAKDLILFIIVECDSCNGAQQPSYYKAQVAFQFPQSYLQGAEAGQVADVISDLLSPDNGGDANSQGGQDAQGGGNPQQAPPAESKQPQTIERGQTEDQVLAILGQPDKTVNLGAKKLYVYKDIKITFIGGRVANVQ